MSSTWRQSADHPLADEYQAQDPAEELLWRWQVQRLQAEQIRDAMLVASGELDPQVGGPSVDESSPRRALYVKSFRNKYDTFLHGFDMANGLKSVPIRDTTTTPLQALLLVNGDYALGRAKAMATRLAAENQTTEELLEECFQLCWGRKPSNREMQQACEYLMVEFAEEQSPVDIDLLADFCHVLLNSNAFLYVD